MDNSTDFVARYIFRKDVLADKIVEIDPHNYWKLESGSIIGYESVRELSKRKAPVVGDYYLRYPDGYQSWCSANEFNEGYTKDAQS